MSGIPFNKHWDKHLEASPEDFKEGSGIFAKTLLLEQDVDDFFETQDRIHKEACEEYGKLEVDLYRLSFYEEARILPEEWEDECPKQELKKPSRFNTNKFNAEMKKKFKLSLEKVNEKQKLISPKVFYQMSAIEWCQYWMENVLFVSWRSPKEMYCKLKKENKEIVHYFVVQCDIYFRERAAGNLIKMKQQTIAKILLIDYEISEVLPE